MSSEIKVRFAKTKDFDFLNSNIYISEEVLRRKIEWQELIVAEKKDIQVGFIQLEYLWSLVPFISLIKVLPNFQKQGVGKQLLEFIESFLIENKHKEIYSSSQVDEAKPQEWHRHVGFKECGMISGINEGIGEVFFRKHLGQS